jgi:hypothetical protein
MRPRRTGNIPHVAAAFIAIRTDFAQVTTRRDSRRHARRPLTFPRDLIQGVRENLVGWLDPILTPTPMNVGERPRTLHPPNRRFKWAISSRSKYFPERT